MTQKFNLIAYKKLLELVDNGKITFLDKNYLKLLNHQALIYNQVKYDRKEDYFLLIQEYLTRGITLYEFQSKLKLITDEDDTTAKIILKDFQKLETFFLAQDLEKFSMLIDRISDLCTDYYEAWDGTAKPMSEDEFYDLVNSYYLQLQAAFSLDI